MCNKKFRILSCMVLVTGALSGVVACSSTSSNAIRIEEKTIAPDINDTTTECNAEGPDAGRGSEGLAGDDTSLGEAE